MPDTNSTPSPRSKVPLVLTVLGIVGAIIGIGRCGAFGHPVDDYGISGALFLVPSAILLIVALVMFIRRRS